MSPDAIRDTGPQESSPSNLPPPLPAALDFSSYPARTSILERPRTYRVQPGNLVVEHHPTADDASRILEYTTQVVPFASITEIRLRFFPTRVQRNRYECVIRTHQHGVFKITNEYFKGMYQFDDQSAAFVTFVTALCRAVATAHPHVRFVGGRDLLPLLLEYGVLAAALLLLAGALWLAGGKIRTLAYVKLGILAVYMPTAIRYLRTNWPSPFDPRQIPTQLLPQPAPA